MPPLMLLGVLLIVLAIGVAILAATGTTGAPGSWAGPMFLAGIVIAIIGGVLRR